MVHAPHSAQAGHAAVLQGSSSSPSPSPAQCLDGTRSPSGRPHSRVRFRLPPPQLTVHAVQGSQLRHPGHDLRLHTSLSVPSPGQLNPKLHVRLRVRIPPSHDFVHAPHDSHGSHSGHGGGSSQPPSSAPSPGHSPPKQSRVRNRRPAEPQLDEQVVQADQASQWGQAKVAQRWRSSRGPLHCPASTGSPSVARHVRSRTRSPPPHDTEHFVHSDHCDSRGHSPALQGDDELGGPLHSNSPPSHCRCRVFSPKPQLTLQLPHSSHSRQRGQARGTQRLDSKDFPSHAVPSHWRERDVIPSPQLTVQKLHSPHSCQTGQSKLLHSRESSADPKHSPTLISD